jgi:hypothetical protein
VEEVMLGVVGIVGDVDVVAQVAAVGKPFG